MGKLKYTLADYQTAARTYRSELLRLPLLGIQQTIQYMTQRPGVRYSEVVGSSSADAQLHPYQKGKRTIVDLNLVLRDLRTYFGALNADFDPNEEIQTLLGHRASQAMGDALANTPQAHEVLANVAKAVSHHLNAAIWSAKRNPTGDKTIDLFDGFDTITAAEITAGNIAEDKGNYIKIPEAITSVNAVDAIKEIMFALDDILRDTQCYLFCSRDIADAYNEAYLMTHSGLVYNKEYNQVTVEGSNGNLIIVPLSNKRGSKYIHVSTKANMLVGFDQMGDEERVDVKEYAPDVLTFMLRMFFGVQFESIDPRRLMVAELADAKTEGDDTPGGTTGGDTPGTNNNPETTEP